MVDDTAWGMISGFLARGWVIIPLHGLADGVCTCEQRGACPNAGKHPIYSNWQKMIEPFRSIEMLGMVSGARGGLINFGLVTGRASGVFALDMDPKNGARLEDLPGTLTPTWMQRTGSGGLHALYEMPTDFSPTNRRGSLPVGWDVRGEGGQIVIAPSVTDRGAYTIIGDVGAIVAPSPGWLLDSIRPSDVADWESRSKTSRFSDRVDMTAPESMEARRAVAYAGTVLDAECGALAGESVSRNETAFRVACRLHELANAGWLSYEVAYGRFMDACAIASGNKLEPFSAGEAERVWVNAAHRVGDAVAVLPASALGGERLDFQWTPPVTGGVSSDVGERFSLPDGWPAAPTEVQVEVDPWEAAVRAEMGKQAVRAEARRRLAEAAAGDRTARLETMRAKLLTSAELASVEPLAALVPGVLYRNTLTRMVGPSGSGKTFVMLDLVGHLGSGMTWAGRALEPSRVLYMVAEGIEGVRGRVEAWERWHDRHMDGVWWYPEPVQACGGDGAWDLFIELACEIKPALVVIDTQARVTVGVNENDNSEMGVMVESLERLRRATEATVTVVHHEGHNEGRARGASAVRGAMQSEHLVSMAADGRTITLSTGKQKDASRGMRLDFGLVSVPLPADEYGIVSPPPIGEELPVVPVWRGDAARVVEMPDEELTGKVGECAAVIRVVFAGVAGGTKAEYKAVLMGERGILGSQATWYRAWSELVGRKVIGRIRGTQAWRYVPVEMRGQMIEPVPGGSERGAHYAPDM